jgi:hypothetical protein
LLPEEEEAVEKKIVPKLDPHPLIFKNWMVLFEAPLIKRMVEEAEAVEVFLNVKL